MTSTALWNATFVFLVCSLLLIVLCWGYLLIVRKVRGSGVVQRSKFDKCMRFAVSSHMLACVSIAISFLITGALLKEGEEEAEYYKEQVRLAELRGRRAVIMELAKQQHNADGGRAKDK